VYGGCKIPVDRSHLLLLAQKEKAKENWRNPHYENLNNKYRSRNAIRVNEIGGVCGTHAGF
jgi:fatty acid-binding protein DegV